ncbi:DUF2520 domain-containing protein [Pedobacter sp. P351]|uniref:Rossmann-like and DUF2520 domain-containing protein n=1 Tax=Pedobacter superstes TaxID=3133441 RepID=UPI00309D2762
MKIVLLGSGNVAIHLGKALKDAGHEIIQVWSRTLEHAKTLGEKLNSEFIINLSKVSDQGDLYIIAVKDDAIKEIARSFPLQNKILVHTSGTTDLNIPGVSGVLYPLQTFSKQKEVDFSEIPIAVEGLNEKISEGLKSLAESISERVVIMTSEQRKALHVAAVFACNFSNHLYAIADKILTDNGLDFDLIKPLIKETTEKVQQFHPVSVQTGPAVRRDQITLNKHLDFLKNMDDLNDLYQKLSQSIINFDQKA